MTKNDLHLVEQMVHVGLDQHITDLIKLCREEKVKKLIAKMGDKYRLHANNFVTRNDFDETRIDIIDANGNEGLHYS